MLRKRYGLIRHIDRRVGVGTTHLRARAVRVGAVRRLVAVVSVVGRVHLAAIRVRHWRSETTTRVGGEERGGAYWKGGERNCPLKVRNLGSRSDFVW